MINTKLKVQDIRKTFIELYKNRKNDTDNLEIIGASFLADEDHIIGNPNQKYIDAEIKWYESMSLNVNDIPYDPIPKIWKMISSSNDEINSNYGYLIWSKENGEQYKNVVNELKTNPNSRRASMIYTRPSIWKDYNRDGMSDFICTNSVTYYIRDNKLQSVVQMRSNDIWAGFRNDIAWQKHVVNKMCIELNTTPGDIVWQVQNLHMYPNNFHLIEAML